MVGRDGSRAISCIASLGDAPPAWLELRTFGCKARENPTQSLNPKICDMVADVGANTAALYEVRSRVVRRGLCPVFDLCCRHLCCVR